MVSRARVPLPLTTTRRAWASCCCTSLVVGHGAQRRHTGQVDAGAGQPAGTRAAGEQQARIADLLSVRKLCEMLPGLDAHHALSDEANAPVLVEAVRARPQLLLAHAPGQVILESRAIIYRKRVIGDNRDIRRVVLCAQDFGGGHPGNAVPDDHILLRHHLSPNSS